MPAPADQPTTAAAADDQRAPMAAVTRRDWLATMAAGVAGLGLATLPSARAADAAPPASATTADPTPAAEPEPTLTSAGLPAEQEPLPLATRWLRLEPGLVYLNTGSVGASPTWVLEHMQHCERFIEQNPTTNEYSTLLNLAEAGRRDVLAPALHAEPDGLFVTRNTTEGMNLVAEGLRLQTGDGVLTTDQEHPGGLFCWTNLAKRDGITVTQVPLPLPEGDPETIVAAFAAAITPRTRVLSVSHVTYTTGLRLPIARLAELAHAHGALLVVDGAQALGAIPVDLTALGCDAYATSTHKWLAAPKGTGLLHIRPTARARIQPLALAGGPRVYTATTGARDLPGIIGMATAMAGFTRIGHARIHAHQLALRGACRARFQAELPGWRWLSPTDPAHGSPMVTIGPPLDADPKAYRLSTLRDRLEAEHRVVVKAISGGPTTAGLRLSWHLYNSPADLDRLLAALHAVLPPA